jgi:hypothetical protein
MAIIEPSAIPSIGYRGEREACGYVASNQFCVAVSK